MAKTIKLFGFPSDATVQKVKLFLQRLTGEDSIYAIILADPKNEGIYDATVEFDSTENAESIISLARASEGLRYDSSTFKAPYYLTAKKMKYDLIPKPRIFVRDLELILVHFGCKIANEKFHILWTAGDVSVDFGSQLHKEVRFLLPYPLEYKLDLSYENIGQIELHRPLDTLVDYLLIQLNGAPRIYAKKLHQDYEDLDMKYFKDNPNDQWIRSVDFTPSYCIGQSSAICLELPYGCQLPDYRKCVASYKVRIGNLILQTSSALSCYHDLVPIVDSPPSVDLPYSILFKINLLVQHGRLSWPTLDEDFYKLVDSSQTNSHLIQYALNQLFHLKEICYEPSKLLKKYTTSETDNPPPRESLDSGFVYVHKVMITPCKVYFCGPELIMSNLVLRNHREDIDNFLRVSFVDEDLNKLHLADVPTPGRCTSSAFQIRYGGYKGIVAVNPTSSMKLSLRKSMCKFE
nr:RNA-dependent RNA polymerase 1-like [Malus domestica]